MRGVVEAHGTYAILFRKVVYAVADLCSQRISEGYLPVVAGFLTSR